MLERVVALAVVAAAGAYLTQAWALPWGTTARPGAGFFPTLVGIFGCVVGLVMTGRAFLAPAGAARGSVGEAAARNRALATIVLLSAFCVLIPWVGYAPVAFGFVAALLNRLGSPWPRALLIGAASAAASYLVFAVLLDVPLPRGPW